MLNADEAGGGAADRVRRDAEQQRDRDGGQGIGNVVGAGDREFGQGHDPAARPHRCRAAAAGQGQPLHARGHDPAILHAKAAGLRPVAPIGHDRSRFQRRVRGHDRIFRVQDKRSRRIDQLGQAPLHCPVRFERPVAVQVIGGDVGVDRDRSPARQRRQLQLGELDDDPMFGRQLGQPLHERDANIAAQDRWMGRVGGKQRSR